MIRGPTHGIAVAYNQAVLDSEVKADSVVRLEDKCYCKGAGGQHKPSEHSQKFATSLSGSAL